MPTFCRLLTQAPKAPGCTPVVETEERERGLTSDAILTPSDLTPDAVSRQVLGLPRQVLASDDHFFRCGGDSLAALTLTKRLMQWEQSGAPDEGGRCTPSLALLPSLARHASLALRRRRLRVPRALGDASCTNIGLFSC